MFMRRRDGVLSSPIRRRSRRFTSVSAPALALMIIAAVSCRKRSASSRAVGTTLP